MNKDEEKKFVVLQKQYWKQESGSKKCMAIEQQMLSIDMPKERYFLWIFFISYGWRQMGCMSGYQTLEELKNESAYKFNMRGENPMIIIQGKICETFRVQDNVLG
jgi:hypothetical protein